MQGEREISFPGDIWQFIEMFLFVTTGHVLLAASK